MPADDPTAAPPPRVSRSRKRAATQADATPPRPDLDAPQQPEPAVAAGPDPGDATDQIVAEAVEVSMSPVGRIEATDVAVSRSAVGLARADRVSVEMGALGAAFGDEVSVSQGYVGSVVAKEVRIEQAGVRTLIARDVHVERSTGILIAIAGRLSGDVRVILDWRGAVVFGAVFGLIVGLLGRGRGRS